MTAIHQNAPLTTVTARLEKNPNFLNEMREHDPEMVNLWDQVDRFRAACQDATCNTHNLHMEPVPAYFEETEPGSGTPESDSFVPAERVRLVAQTPQGGLPMTVFDGAHRQIADRIGMPRKYYARCLDEAPDLAAANVNYWLKKNQENRMLRMVSRITDSDQSRLTRTQTKTGLRAFLGSTYRPIDHLGLLNHILPAAFDTGAQVQDWNLAETKFRVKFVTPEEILDRFLDDELRRVLGDRYGKGNDMTIREEVMQFGVSLSNSETGHGMVAIEPLVKVVRCTNLLVVVESKGIRHVGGRRNGADNEFAFRVDTERLAGATVYHECRDSVLQVFTRDAAEKTAKQIAERAGTAIELPDEMPMLQFVENIGGNFELNEQETAILQEEVLNEMQFTGGEVLSPWTLTQGLTATAKRVDDYERGDELQRTGWKVLNDTTERLLAAGTKPSKN